MEHQVNDDKEHHDSDDVSGIQGFASWTSVLGKRFMDVSAAEYVISRSIIDAYLTSESLPARDGFGCSSRGADALQSPDHDQVAVRVANGSAAVAFAVAIRATAVQYAGQAPLPTQRPPEWCVP